MRENADEAARMPATAKRRLLLFVVGDETNSRLARENLARICNSGSESRCEVVVIDVLESYDIALEHNILITPALLAVEPQRTLIFGNLSDHDTVRAALGL